VESGRHSDRPQLEKALAACKKLKAKLVIAKLDRLSRNLAFIATLMESGVDPVVLTAFGRHPVFRRNWNAVVYQSLDLRWY